MAVRRESCELTVDFKGVTPLYRYEALERKVF